MYVTQALQTAAPRLAAMLANSSSFEVIAPSGQSLSAFGRKIALGIAAATTIATGYTDAVPKLLSSMTTASQAAMSNTVALASAGKLALQSQGERAAYATWVAHNVAEESPLPRPFLRALMDAHIGVSQAWELVGAHKTLADMTPAERSVIGHYAMYRANGAALLHYANNPGVENTPNAAAFFKPFLHPQAKLANGDLEPPKIDAQAAYQAFLEPNIENMWVLDRHRLDAFRFFSNTPENERATKDISKLFQRETTLSQTFDSFVLFLGGKPMPGDNSEQEKQRRKQAITWWATEMPATTFKPKPLTMRAPHPEESPSDHHPSNM